MVKIPEAALETGRHHPGVETPYGGQPHLGWTAAGQWFRYTLRVASAGTCTAGALGSVKQYC